MMREEALRAFIVDARWFGGKGRDFELGQVRVLPHGIHLVEVRYADGSHDIYQVPLSTYAEPEERLGHALVGEWDGAFHYDAVHDRDAMADWLRAFDRGTGEPADVGAGTGPETGAETGAETGPETGADTGAERLTFHRVPGEHQLDLEARSTLFSGEQSNSSVAFGEDSLMKVFRRITPGTNPDIEIHRVLTEAGSEHVARLYGWVESDGIDLAMLQQFLRTATEGWVFALTSVRNLFAEADLYPEEVGGDFAAEAQRLGTAVAEVHETLRKHFPTEPLDVRAVAATMRGRLEATVADVPDLAAHAGAADAAFDALARLDPGSAGDAQRIHGDLHLGQTLRTSLGWKLVDFEGEPAKPLAERGLPDSPWRDVAGMLRSLDYAARTAERERGASVFEPEHWLEQARHALLQAYRSGGMPVDDGLLRAFELEKACYEVHYEANNRPDWVWLPLAALRRT
jgi:maltokinase